MLSELVQAGLTGLPLSDAGTHATGILAAPKGIDTSGILKFLASKIAPILLAVLGLIFIGRANKGEVSRVLTSSAIAIVGLVFIGGAVTLLFLGNYLINLFFT